MGVVAAAGATPAVPVAGRVKVGWFLFAVTLVMGAAALALELHAGNLPSLIYVGVDVALASVAVLLTTRRPEHRISWVLAITAFAWAIGPLAHAYAVEAVVTSPGTLPGGIVAAWIDNWTWLPALALPLSALLLLMPDGHLASRRWWPVPAVVVAGAAAATLAVSGSPTFDLGTDAAIDNPLSLHWSTVAAAGIAGGILVVAGLVASFVAFVVRYRASSGDARQQLRWVGATLGLAVPLAILGAVLWGVVPGAAVLPAVAFLLLPAGIAVAVLKYRLYDLDLVVNRAAVYAVITICVVGGYVAAVGLIGALLSSGSGLVVSLVVTGMVAISFQPLRARVQRFVNRLMYGERDDPYAAIARLGRSLTSSIRPDAVLPGVVETVGQTLALQFVGLVVDGEPRAEFGAPGREILTFPLVHQGVAVGELRVSPRPGERLRERDHRLIEDLAPQVAAAVSAVDLSRELQSAGSASSSCGRRSGGGSGGTCMTASGRRWRG